MKLIPFGECMEERIAISKEYGLIEMTSGIWRLTEKCRKHYDSISYLLYLRGEVEKPERIKKENKKQEISKTETIKQKRQMEINGVLSL